METAALKSTEERALTEKSAHIKYQRKLFVGSSHSWALKHLRALPSKSTILDIGAGSGFVGELLMGEGITNVHAVEIDQQAREHIGRFYSATFKTLTEAPDNSYDAIVLLDVLEHTPSPEEFLKVALQKLKSGGKVLISVPNIAHWSVRFPLLLGFFDYQERGLLDKTHLQFFTRKRLKQLISSYGLNPLESSSSIEPIELILPQWIWDNFIFRGVSQIRLFVSKTLPGLFAFQHLNISVK